MSKEDIERERKELLQKLDPRLLEKLRKRGAEKLKKYSAPYASAYYTCASFRFVHTRLPRELLIGSALPLSRSHAQRSGAGAMDVEEAKRLEMEQIKTITTAETIALPELEAKKAPTHFPPPPLRLFSCLPEITGSIL
jgi:hypothetical protein